MKFSYDTIAALFESKYPQAYLDFEMKYGESGYTNPDSGILLANWNHVPKFVQSYLERNAFALEWSDEWIRSDIGKVYLTSPQYHGWKPSFVITENSSVIGKDEVLDNTAKDEYIEYLLNDPSKCDVFDLDWINEGFTKCNPDSYETGFHAGQNDDPKKVFDQVKKEYPNCDFVFVLDETSQFYSKWSVFRKEREED